MDNTLETTHINYHFLFKDGSEEFVPVNLRLKDLSYIAEGEVNHPPWARLDFNKCENCPLNAKEHPYCPVAVSIGDVIPKFKDRKSFETVLLRVTTPERVFEKVTPLQQGLGSLLGIFMVTTGCPHMRTLRPMARFHLPFATVEETVYRAATTYLLAQYFRMKKNLTPDWDLKSLAREYENIQTVNMGITDRLRSISEEDANANAIVVLDVFAKALPSSIFVDLRELEYLFTDRLSDR
jgi:hypothetical protein